MSKDKSLESKLGLASRFLTEERIGSNKDKKQNELEICKGFLERLGVDANSISIEQSETPDIILSIGDIQISVEITMFFTDSAKKGSAGNTQFEIWKSFSGEIKNKLLSERLECWYGSIFFKIDIDLQKVDRNKLLVDLIDLLKIHLIGTEDKRVEPASDSFLAQYIDTISCTYHAEAQNIGLHWWHAGLQSGAALSDDTVDILVKICQEKDAIFKKANVSNKAKENWLLIYARGSHLWDLASLIYPSTMHRHEQDRLLTEKSSPLHTMKMESFDKVFFWSKRFEAIWEIWPKPQVLHHRDKDGFLLRINNIPQVLNSSKKSQL